ncbi:MAG: hypothetical protein HZB16_07685 [Armatimonadetes bacterium]|nr:hypothetical protein [Armatimonadota bacterium]
MRLRPALIALSTLALVGAGRAQEPSQAQLAGLFPKPPATLLSQLAVAPGRQATLWQLPTGALRLGLAVRGADGAWSLSLNLVKVLDLQTPARLSLLALPGRYPAVVAIDGQRGESGRLNLVAAAEGKLTFLLAADHAPGQPPEAADINDDGQAEVILTVDATPLWPGQGPWLDRRVAAYRLGADGTFQAAPLWADPGDPQVQRLLLLRDGRLWPAAVSLATALAQRRAEAGPLWNLALTRFEADWFGEQADRLRLGSSSVQKLASAAAQTLAGQLDGAALSLLSFGGPVHLPDGWTTPMAVLGRTLELARRADPGLGDNAHYLVLRGFAASAQGLDQAARTAWRRAATIDAGLPGLSAWLGGSKVTSRLWVLDARDMLHAVDLTADGEPAGPLAPLAALGRLSAVAGRASVPGLVALSADGQRVLATSDGQSARNLLTGQGLDLLPEAVSPDGRWVGVGEAGALRVIALDDGRQALRLAACSGYLWSPDSRQLAVRSEAGLQLVDVPGGQTATLAASSEALRWTLVDWSAGQPLRAVRHRVSRDATGALAITGSQRVALRAGAEPVADDRPEPMEELARQVMLRTRPGELTQPLTAVHPLLLAWRAGQDQRTLLYVGPRADTRRAAVAPSEPFDHRLRAAWSQAPEPTP